MLTSNSYRDVMAMPMPVFTMIFRHATKIEEDHFSRILMELCDVNMVAYSGPGNYHEGLKSHYRSRLLPEKDRQKLRNPRVFDTSDKEQSIQAANILAATLKKKAQLMGIKTRGQ